MAALMKRNLEISVAALNHSFQKKNEKNQPFSQAMIQVSNEQMPSHSILLQSSCTGCQLQRSFGLLMGLAML